MNETEIARLLDAIESISRRMDKIENSRGDASIDTRPEPGDAKRVVADADESQSLAEAMRETQRLKDELRRRQNVVDRKMREAQPLRLDEERALTDAQARADCVYSALGKRSAPAPYPSERPHTYRARLLKELRQYSPAWKSVGTFLDFDGKALNAIEDEIYNDAQAWATRPTDLPRGELREVKKVEPTGHKVSEFFGRESFIVALKPPIQHGRIADPREYKLRELLANSGF